MTTEKPKLSPDYKRISDIPESEREEFRKWMWMTGQTCPMVDGEGPCVYTWDYERWKKIKRRGYELVEEWD